MLTTTMEVISFTCNSGEIHLILSILLILPLLFVISRHKSSKLPPLPPGPYSWPIIGNLPQIGEKAHIAFAQLAQAHGPLIKLRLGTQLVVVGSSKAAATEILKIHDRILSGRHVPHALYVRDPTLNHLAMGWTFECTEQWKYLRALCRSELFSSKTMDRQSHIREKKVHEMREFLSINEGKMVQIGEVVFASMFNFLGNILLSNDFIGFDEESEGGGMKGIIRGMMEVLTAPNISDLYPILGGLDLQRIRRKGLELTKKMSDLWQSIICERRERRSGDECSNDDFLDVLLDSHFTDEQINQLFLELFAAGTDTSTSTVEWAMAELIRNQKAMRKILEELEREIPDKIVRETHLPSLSYLHACVKETLRLHPPAPLLLPRRVTENCKVMNYTIPKDTKVLVNVWAIGRDPSLWEEPLSFNPERFLGSELDFRGNNFEFLPFGGGRRICPGLPSALRQVHLTLASLLHTFDWSLPMSVLPEQLDMNEKFGVTLQKEEPLVIIPKRRI